MATEHAPDAAVQEVRSAIERSLVLSASGPLAVVLADPVSAGTWTVKMLDVHPCAGKVAGRRLLAELGIPERTRVADLSAEQIALLAGAAAKRTS